MRIAFIAAECEPWAKTGGLGDVVDALARALPRAVPGPGGEPVTAPVDVFLPRYRSVPVPPGRPPVDRRPRARSARAERRRRRSASSRSRPTATGSGSWTTRRRSTGPAFYDHPDDAWRFGIFGRAALEALRADAAAGEPPVDVLSLHDWHSSPALLDRAGRLRRRSGHRPGGGPADDPQPRLPRLDPGAPTCAQLGLAPGDGLVAPGAVGIDLLWDAIERAELVNTVSPGFAAEALTPAFGFGLDATLRAKGDRFVGILNGLDTEVWDPATDELQVGALLAGRPGRQGRLPGRPAHPPRPRRDRPGDGHRARRPARPAEGLRPAARRRPAAARRRRPDRRPGQRAIRRSRRACARWPSPGPTQVAFIDRFDRTMARRIYAGSDAFAMPSRFEPCGQGQMIALRYGTPPIVHATGGLRDTVVDEHDRPGEGTGFAFRFPTADGLAWAAEEAMERFDARAPGRSAGTPSSTAGWPSTSTGSAVRRPRTSPRSSARSACAGPRRAEPDMVPRGHAAAESRVAPRYRSRGTHPGGTVGRMWRRSGSSSAETWLVAAPRRRPPGDDPAGGPAHRGRRGDDRRHRLDAPSRAARLRARAATRPSRSTTLHYELSPADHRDGRDPRLRAASGSGSSSRRRPRPPGAYDVAWDGRVAPSGALVQDGGLPLPAHRSPTGWARSSRTGR